MKCMLDTNICIYLIKNKPESVIEKFMQMDIGDVCISAITYAELMHGVENSRAKERNALALNLLLTGLTVLPFDSTAAQSYGVIRAELQKKGTPIGPLDTLIAAHAKSLDMLLVTNNTREFERVSGLRIENWV